jgi:hypothetical protein
MLQVSCSFPTSSACFLAVHFIQANHIESRVCFEIVSSEWNGDLDIHCTVSGPYRSFSSVLRASSVLAGHLADLTMAQRCGLTLQLWDARVEKWAARYWHKVDFCCKIKVVAWSHSFVSVYSDVALNRRVQTDILHERITSVSEFISAGNLHNFYWNGRFTEWEFKRETKHASYAQYNISVSFMAFVNKSDYYAVKTPESLEWLVEGGGGGRSCSSAPLLWHH